MNNLTKIASLPQGGGCKAALVGEVQSVRDGQSAYEVGARLVAEKGSFTRTFQELFDSVFCRKTSIGDGSSD